MIIAFLVSGLRPDEAPSLDTSAELALESQLPVPDLSRAHIHLFRLHGPVLQIQSQTQRNGSTVGAFV